MDKRNLRDTVKRLVTGKASEQDIKLFDALIHQSQTAKKEIPEQAGDKIWREVSQATINKTTPVYAIGGALRIAASIAVVLGLGILLYLGHPATPGLNYITKSTTRGQKATITLSDGSTVRLNAESSLTYPEQFSNQDTRNVQFTGEAFFEVARNESKPFVVTAHQLETTVLGTSFNIDAYDPGQVAVALVEGKVKVNAISAGLSSSASEQILAPGQQALYDASSGLIALETADIKQLTAWKDGIIYLKDANHAEVFARLEKWYGVSFEFINRPKEKWEVSGEFEDMSLELVLNTIGNTKGFTFDIQNDTIKIEFKNKN